MVVNGSTVELPDEGASLLDVLRNRLGLTSVKDGCSPQGQCGCCTVLVDGQARVSCVTPARRVKDRKVTTLEGLDDAHKWADALCATGGSQCGFCTPGIVMRLAATEAKHGPLDEDRTKDALKAHLCRCTGWQTIVEAAVDLPKHDPGRDLDLAGQRAQLEGGTQQIVAPSVSMGNAGFADDTAPADALIAVMGADGEWVVAETLTEARATAGKVQGRRTTANAEPPIAVPDGDWDLTLSTSWVEPAYLETDASWCVPGGEPATVLANGGAFGAKLSSEIPQVAARLANKHGRAVRVLASREDSVRNGPKRPPLAAGINADGSGVIRVAQTPGIAEAIAQVAPNLDVEEVQIAGPPTSAALRAAGWAEALILLHAANAAPIVAPNGATASATFDGDTIAVEVDCGTLLDHAVARSYAIGAAHMAYSWVTAESLTLNPDGHVEDLTVRSFNIVRAVDTPRIDVTFVASQDQPINGSDAAFAAVAAAVWQQRGLGAIWPTG